MRLFSRAVSSRTVRVAVCVALLIGILIIAILPELDLPPTVLRAWQITSLLLAQLAALLVLVGVPLTPSRPVFEGVFLGDEGTQKGRSRLSVTCSLRR
jgi:hypothetical protein